MRACFPNFELESAIYNYLFILIRSLTFHFLPRHDVADVHMNGAKTNLVFFNEPAL